MVTRHSVRGGLIGPALLILVTGSSCGRLPALGIGERETRQGPIGHAIPATAAQCAEDAVCPAGLSCQGGFCVAEYYQDTTDGGDNYMVPGCHWAFTDAACTQHQQFYAGDACLDLVHLAEWHDRTCHQNMDVAKYNCDDECKQMGHGAGRCVPVKNACGPGNDSAKCLCIEVVE